MYEYKLRIPFKCLNRADLLLREGEIERLRSASCEIVWIGAYSGSQKILDAMEKGITVEQVKEATQRIHKAGISVGYFLQFGYPGESHDDIMQTIRLVIDQQPDDIGISVSYPLPGTPFYERVKSEIGKKKNWTDSNDLSSLYKSPYPTRYYRLLYKVVHKIHRLSKGKKRDHLDHLIHSKRSHAAGNQTSIIKNSCCLAISAR